jgi:hypothetical protein
MEREQPQLQLRFKTTGDDSLHVKDAARIEIGGRRGLLLFGSSGSAEEIDLNSFHLLSIQTLGGSAHRLRHEAGSLQIY